MTKTTRPSKRALRGGPPTQRATPAFHLIRALCIRELAFQGKTTEEIAALFGVNRSFIIKQSTIILKPRTDKERAILKVANSIAHGIDLNFVDLLAGEDLKTELAGAAVRGGKTYQNTPKTPQKGAKTPQKGAKTAPKTPVSRGKKPLKGALGVVGSTPRRPRLKMAAPQEPLDRGD